MRPNSSHLAALAAAALCAAAAAWLWLSEHPEPDLGPPRAPVSPVQRLEASVPDIAPFAAYSINAENPFIPYALRGSEREGLTRKPTPTAPPPVEVVKPASPVLPRLPAGDERAPAVAGFITLPDGSIQAGIAAGSPGGPALIPIGGTVAGWTLVRVEHGVAAVWRDARGAEVRSLAGGSAGGPDAAASASAAPARPAAAPRGAATPPAAAPSGAPPRNQRPAPR